MAEIATAYVALLPSFSGGSSAISKQLAGPLDAAGKAGGKRFGSSLTGSLGPALKGIGASLAGMFAVREVAQFFKAAYSEATEARKVTAQTAAVIKSTGGVAKVSADHIGAYATKLSVVAGVDDEVVQSGQNLLLTFTNIRNGVGKNNQIFDQATSTMLDMSAALGQDAKSSAIQLGKALNDPIRGVTALRRVGVSFTEAQQDQIKALTKSGDLMGAQKLVLAELTKEFGGSAAAIATPAERMKVAWSNLKEFIGTAFTPLVDLVANKLAPAVSNVTEGMSALYGIMSTGSTAGVEEAFGWAKDSSIVTGLLGIRDAFKSIFSGDFAAGAEKLRAPLQGVLDWLVNGGIRSIADALVSSKGTVFEAAMQLFPAIIDALVATLPKLALSLGQLVTSIVTFLGTAIPQLLTAGVTMFMSLVRAVAQALPLIVGAVITILPQLVSTLLAMVPRILQTAVTLFSTLVQAVARILPNLLGSLVGMLPQLASTIISMVPQILNAAVTLFTALLTAVVDVLPRLVVQIVAMLPKITGAVLQMLPQLLAAAIQLFTALVTAVIRVLPQLIVVLVGTVLPRLIGTLIQMIPQLLGTAVKLFGTLVKGLVQIVPALLGALVSAFGQLLRAVGDFGASLGRKWGEIWASVTRALGSFFDGAKRAFSQGVDALGRAWDGLKEVARKPVQFVVDVVYNNGIRALWNKVSGVFGGPQLGAIKFAAGGMVPLLAGASTGRDSVLSALTPGEFVVRRDGSNLPDALHYYGIPGYKDGGVVGALKTAGNFAVKVFTDPVGAVSDLLGGVVDHIPGVGGTPWGDLVKRIPRKIADGLGSLAKKLVEKFVPKNPPGAVGGGVARWTGTVQQALQMLGQPASLTPWVLRLIQHESGGNPAAINNWDINARNGVPSQGLMQTIPPTFAAYAGPLRGRGILDPLANVYAGLNYGIHRYGSVARIPGIASLMRGGGYQPYASGGIVTRPTFALIGEAGPEAIVPLTKTSNATSANDAFGRLVTEFGGLLAGALHVGLPAVTKRVKGEVRNVSNALMDAFGDFMPKRAEVESALRQSMAAVQNAGKMTVKQLQDVASRARDAAKSAMAAYDEALKSVNELLAQARQVRDDFAEQVKSSALDFGSIMGSNLSGEDLTGTGLVDYLSAQTQKIRDFQATLGDLVGMGLDKELYRQLVQAGVSAGSPVAEALRAAGPDIIAELNARQKDLEAASAGLASDTSKVLYQEAVDIMKSFRDGLRDQRGGVYDEATALVSVIEDAVQRAISNISGKPAAKKGVKKYASGGLVTRPTFALIGESGPELVVPLTRATRVPAGVLQSSRRADAGVQVNAPLVGTAVIREEVDVDLLASRLAWKIGAGSLGGGRR